MMDVQILDNLIKLLIVAILITGSIIIMRRDLLALISMYAAQSLLLAILALVLFDKQGGVILLGLAVLIIASKVVVIPMFMRRVQRQLRIKRDTEFGYLSPVTAIFVGVMLMVVIYKAFGDISTELGLSRLFFLGATTGVALMFLGMMVIFTRKQTMTNIVGYLMMENGVLLFSMFVVELPLIIEALIVVDLIMITLIATVLALGIDSSREEFAAKLAPVRRLLGRDRL